MNLRERTLGDVTVLALEGKLVFGDGDQMFTDRVNALVREGRRYLVLNMKEVTYVDSCGVGALASKFATARKAGGTIKLASLTPRSQVPLSIAKLLKVLEVFDTEEEAVRSFDPDLAKTGGFTILHR